MDNLKRIKTIFSKNDTSVTLLSSVVVFILPVVVFSFCYFAQNDACAYAIKDIDVLEKDLKVVSIQSVSSVKLSMIGLE